jgi:hypothetical protein
MPSPPTPPGSPAAPPFPPGVLVYVFQTPKPDRYMIHLALGDANAAVTHQTISVYDGNTFLATLVNDLSAPANNYIDAQSNVLSAAAWPGLNAPQIFFFQTNQVVFYIGDGVNQTFVATIHVRADLATERVGKVPRLWRRRWLRKGYKRILFPFGFQPLAGQTVRAVRKRTRPRKLRLIKRKLYPLVAPPAVATTRIVKPKRLVQFKRRKLHCIARKRYIPVVFKPPVVIPWRAHLRPVPKIRRTRHFLARKRYPLLGVATVPSGHGRPGDKVVVIVR